MSLCGSSALWEHGNDDAAANRLSAAEAIAQLASGALTAEALTRACLDRAAERASVKAWTWLDPEQALAQARAADRAGRPGLLAGLPIGVKDIIDTADMPTEHGSPIYRGNRPFADAACVALLRMAGGTIMGKTVTTEFANRFPGETVNPHNPAHTPGGSSSGSAAAVADFQVPAALGTQTGGSVIRPSAFCGVVGYKPSFGEFSRGGIKLQCHNLDTLGIICRTVEDLPPLRAAILDAPRRDIDRGVVGAAHRLLPHPGLGARRRGDAGADRDAPPRHCRRPARGSPRSRSRRNSRTSSNTTAASSISRRRATTPTNTSSTTSRSARSCATRC